MAFNLTALLNNTSNEIAGQAGNEIIIGMDYKEINSYIRQKIKGLAKHTIQLGYYLKQVRDNNLFTEGGYKDLYEYAMTEFGLSSSSVSRFMSANDEYSVNGYSIELAEQYADYNSSQLIEMVDLDKEQRESITPETTVKEIRQIKKKIKQEKKRDADLPSLTVQEADTFPELLPTKHIDICECIYCHHKWNGDEATNHDTSKEVITCPSCKQEMGVLQSVEYECYKIG